MEERPDGSYKKYPGADGVFTDKNGWDWQARRIPYRDSFLYMHWDYEGRDMGGSSLDSDGTFKPMTSKELDEYWAVGKIMRA